MILVRIVSSTYNKDTPKEVTYGEIELYDGQDKEYITEGYLFHNEAIDLIQEAQYQGVMVQLVVEEYSGDGLPNNEDLISSAITIMEARSE